MEPAAKRSEKRNITKIAERLNVDAWLSLALAEIDDHPMFEYRTKDGEYIAFSDASAGQQATALLRVLLNQEGPPLIIDQPEDDLDSQVVLEIVEQIWLAKSRRQLIFSSHNANLVVNGDAELVVCCDYRAAGDQSGGRIKTEGAIDVGEVRAEITSIMEGGEKAFRLRKDKYGF
jgi:ABC-type cobalamin/Fe3+-siderophores transport system ATPase subunit